MEAISNLANELDSRDIMDDSVVDELIMTIRKRDVYKEEDIFCWLGKKGEFVTPASTGGP